MNPQANTISPFTFINSHIDHLTSTNPSASRTESDARGFRLSSASTTTRQKLEEDLLAAHEKMMNLENLERHPVSSPGESRSPGGRSSAEGEGRSDLAAQLQVAREQIDILVHRINALEVQADSAWGVDISDESPPEYV
ncbi:hypothetical protein C8R44DRAFT_870926 [Mycena epipterygia]|nr:hypothetical protein C8R44DRAFT_870926 [Mycena epipterygia]